MTDEWAARDAAKGSNMLDLRNHALNEATATRFEAGAKMQQRARARGVLEATGH